MCVRRDDIAARLRAHLPLDVHLAVVAAARHVPHLPALAAARRAAGARARRARRARRTRRARRACRPRRRGGARACAFPQRLVGALRHLHQYVAAQARPRYLPALYGALKRRRAIFSHRPSLVQADACSPRGVSGSENITPLHLVPAGRE